MFTRPKPGEGEEDILKLQEDFMKNKSAKPSASVINKRKVEHGTVSNVDSKSAKGDDNTDSKRPRSKFSASKGNQQKPHPVVSSVVLGDVKERVFTQGSVRPPNAVQQQAFPEVFVRDKMVTAKGRSIFAEHMKKKQGVTIFKPVAGPATETEDGKTKQISTESSEEERRSFGERSFILSGPYADEIHNENVKKLSEVPVKELQKTREQLISQIDPNILQFIRSRRKVPTALGDAKNTSLVAGPSAMEEDAAGMSSTEQKSAMCGSVSEADGITVMEQMNEFEKQHRNTVGGSNSNTKMVDSAVLEVVAPLGAEANKWLHMDVVEQEKLQWMTDLPQPQKILPETPYNARFDFQGVLLPYTTEEVDVRKALHHHGEEPERPGYTLQELLQLSRSSVLQQRVLALNTLANILDKVKGGYYDECLQEPLLKQMMDADIFLLLRFSLDDSTETVITAALLALRNLLWNQPDEICLDRLLGCYRGLVQPSLWVKADAKVKPSEKQEKEDEEAELKDYQMLCHDLIKGALRTDLVVRLRYVLEVLRPGPKAVIATLEILTRLVRHSHDATLAVTCCPRLLATIISNFVPRDWAPLVGAGRPVDMTSVYGIPLVEALKLLRIIASRSRNLASELYHKHSVMRAVLGYISIDPRECGLPHQEALRLSIESFYLWQTFLSYNIATVDFMDLYPILMRLVQFHISATSVSDVRFTFGHEHGAAVMSMLCQAMMAAYAQGERLQNQQQTAAKERVQITLDLSHFTGFTQSIEMCFMKWMSELAGSHEFTFSSFKLVSSVFDWFTFCWEKFYEQLSSYMPAVDAVTTLERVQRLVEKYLLPFIQSRGFGIVMSQLRSASCLLNKESPGTGRDPDNLPSVGALLWGGQVTPLLRPGSPFPFVQGLARLLLTAYRLHKGLGRQCLNLFVSNEHLQEYLKLVVEVKSQQNIGWFTQYETFFLGTVLKLSFISDSSRSTALHSIALRLTSLLQAADKLLLRDLLEQIVFNAEFFTDNSGLVYNLEALTIDEDTKGKSIPRHKLLLLAIKNLPDVRSHYCSTLGLASLHTTSILDTCSLTLQEMDTDVALPGDWPFMPLVALYNQGLGSQSASEEVTHVVTSCLRWVFILECLQPAAFAAVGVTARFCRLLTIFLAGTDLFLDPVIHSYLDAILHELLKKNSEFDFSQKIPGLTSFYDLYTQLLEQFAAVSYGDHLFGHFVLVPLQQRHSVTYRHLVWGEQAGILRVLSTPPEQLSFCLSELLDPCETDPSLLMSYLRCLASGFREFWSPVLYRVALHHVSTFIKLHPETTPAQQIKGLIEKISNKELRTSILEYQSDTIKS